VDNLVAFQRMYQPLNQVRSHRCNHLQNRRLNRPSNQVYSQLTCQRPSQVVNLRDNPLCNRPMHLLGSRACSPQRNQQRNQQCNHRLQLI
jgi:hypothetical protein